MLVLKFILIAVVVLVLLLLVLHLIAPKEAKLERSVLISASKEAIFSLHSVFCKTRRMVALDGNGLERETELEGEDGTLNAVWRWEGNNKVGKGHQKNTNIVPNESVDTIVTFEKPWQSQAGSYLRLEEKTDATMVRWGFSTKMSFPFTILGLLMNMDKAVGKDYEKGLNKLKKLVEG
jgi:hypothetical protein